MFYHSGSWAEMILSRVAAARCTFAVWRRRFSTLVFSLCIVERLFKMCVIPVLDYGNCLWGARPFVAAEWKVVEAFWRNAARTIVGVPQRTPTEALGVLGWHEYSRRVLYQVVKNLTRLIELPNDVSTRKALDLQASYSSSQ
jgi:hypothetical protein